MADAAAPKKQVKKAAAKPKKVATHPKYSEMVAAAVGSLKERGGSSRVAVLKYIVKNYTVGSNETAVNARVKTALKAGVKAGGLKQSKGTGATGSFKLGEKPKVQKPKAKKSAAKKPAAKKVKKPKSPKKAAKPKTAKPKKAKTPKKVLKAKSPKKPAVKKPAAKKPAAKKAAKKPAAKK